MVISQSELMTFVVMVAIMVLIFAGRPLFKLIKNFYFSNTDEYRMKTTRLCRQAHALCTISAVVIGTVIEMNEPNTTVFRILSTAVVMFFGMLFVAGVAKAIAAIH